MPLLKRPDGSYLKKLHPFRKVLPYLFKTRNESVLYYKVDFDLKKTLPFLEEKNKNRSPEEKVTLFHIILNAAVRTFALKPHLNRFVSGYRIYQRNKISFNFVVKKEMTEEGQEVNKKVNFDPYETIDTLSPKCRSEVKHARSEAKDKDESIMNVLVKLPRFLIRSFFWLLRKLDYYNLAPSSLVHSDPLMCSCFVASLGNMGLDSLYHHMFEWGSNSVFLLIGKIKKIPVVNDNDSIVVKKVVGVTFSLDDRVSEAIYFKNSLDLLQNFVENPELLEEKPDIPQKTLDQLMLKTD